MTPAGWAIAALAIAAALFRPAAAAAALARGVDVYLFLIGMMALAEFARAGSLFTWVAARAIDLAGGSRVRLFALVYAAGIVTTALLSNDATIVVLTPAVIDALRRIDAKPAAYVVACALVANAASFVLPISNPSNLLVFAGRMPSLAAWFARFGAPSLAALAVTFAVLAWWYRRDLGGNATTQPAPAAEPPRRLYAIVLAAAALVMIATSAFAGPLGYATFACALGAFLLVVAERRADAFAIVRGIAWPVVALTAALFVIVAAVDAAGGLAATRAVLAWCAGLAAPWSRLATGFAVAIASNAVNNLPVGLDLGEALPAMHATADVASSALVGVNLGPNATVNGSLATILWLATIRRAKIPVTPLGFAAIGIATTIPALVAALMLVR
jgi:arsenical pump membrane protein